MSSSHFCSHLDTNLNIVCNLLLISIGIVWEKLPSNTQLSNETRDILNSFPSDWPDIQYIFNTAGPPDNTPGDLLSLGVVILKPSSIGSVSLNSSSDTAENPLVDVAWFTTEADRELGVAAVRRLRLFANATGVVESEISPGPKAQTDEQILEFIKGAATPSHHAVGTCESNSHKHSVLSYLRFWHCKN